MQRREHQRGVKPLGIHDFESLSGVIAPGDNVVPSHFGPICVWDTRGRDTPAQAFVFKEDAV